MAKKVTRHKPRRTQKRPRRITPAMPEYRLVLEFAGLPGSPIELGGPHTFVLPSSKSISEIDVLLEKAGDGTADVPTIRLRLL